MNPILLLVGMVIVVGALAQLPGLWAGPRMARLLRNVRRVWPYGDRLLLGWGRALPCYVVAAALMMLGLTLDLLDEALLSGSNGAVRVVELSLFALAGAAFIIGTLLLAIGRPKALVPPSVRGVRTFEDLEDLARGR